MVGVIYPIFIEIDLPPRKATIAAFLSISTPDACWMGALLTSTPPAPPK